MVIHPLHSLHRSQISRICQRCRLSRVPCLANKSIAFCYHLVRMFEKVAPDASWFNQVRKRPSKRFDGQPTIVSARLDCAKDGREVYVTTPGYSAVVVCP